MGPDQWQKLILDDWLGERAGKWASLTCGLAVPRQNGKNGALEIREIFGMVGLGEKILHTAHEVKTAQKHFRRLKHFFGTKANDPAAAYPELNALVAQVRSVNGQEAIFLKAGGSIEIVARSKNSSRGFTVDVLVFDEAQELDEDAKEALIPTTASAPLGNPQWIYTGTPPGPNAQGGAFTRTRTEALDGSRKRISWIEWSVPEGDVDINDEALAYATNPQLDRPRPNGAYGLQWEIVEGERGELSPDGFARERLGQWPAVTSTTSLIKDTDWAMLAEDPAEVTPGRMVIGVKFSIDGALSGLAVGVRPDNGAPVHVDGIRLASTGEGMRWIVDWIVSRREEITQIVIDGRGADAVLIRELGDHGIKARTGVKKASSRTIRVPSSAEYAEAHTVFLDDIRAQVLSHGPSPTLDGQVTSSIRRKIGNSGGWGWQSIRDTDNTCLLDAATLAYWGAKTVTRRPAGSRQTIGGF